MCRSCILLLFAFIFSTVGQAQINFEPGYFIDNKGVRTECLIRNVDSKKNPENFKYRFSEEGDIKTGTLKEVKEFQIDGAAQYIRYTLPMDRSTDLTDRLDTDQRIEFNEETHFLKILVSGAAKLYYFEANELQRFFFRTKDSIPEQLVYKRYRKDQTGRAPSPSVQQSRLSKSQNQIATVNTYRQQLWNALKCQGMNENSIKKLRYKRGDLVDLFEQYNSCMDPEYVKTERGNFVSDFNFSLRAGINSSSLSVDKSNEQGRDVDYDNATSFRFGVEIEAVLPFNKNKWSLFIEPTYLTYENEGETNPSVFVTRQTTVAYRTLEIPFGIRHYLFLNDKTKLYFNAGYTIAVPFDSKLTYGGLVQSEVGFETSGNFSIGTGIKVYDKLAVEARYRAPRELFGNGTFVSYTSNYAGFSIIFGYTLF